jgi:hypothetical protein
VASVAGGEPRRLTIERCSRMSSSGARACHRAVLARAETGVSRTRA